MIRHAMRLAVLAVAVPMAISACSWLAPEKPARPVAELQNLAAPVQGAILWRKDTGEGEVGTRLQLALDGNRIFAADGSGAVMAIDAGNGSALWRTDLDVKITGGVGVGSGLVLTGTADGELVALDAASGARRWATRVSSEILSVPAAAQGVVVARTNDGKAIGFDAAAGSPLWTYERDVPVLSLRGAASPVIYGSQVVCGLDGGRLVNLDLATGKALWDVSVSYPTGRTDLERVVDIDAAPLVVGDAVFVATFQGSMAALNLATGARGWVRPFSSYNRMAAGPNALYATDEFGHLWAVEPSTGNNIWTQKSLSGRQLSPPAFVGRWVAVGDLEGYLHWIDPATGDIKGRIRVGDEPIQAPLVAAGDVVYVLAADGGLAAVRAP